MQRDRTAVHEFVGYRLKLAIERARRDGASDHKGVVTLAADVGPTERVDDVGHRPHHIVKVGTP